MSAKKQLNDIQLDKVLISKLFVFLRRRCLLQVGWSERVWTSSDGISTTRTISDRCARYEAAVTEQFHWLLETKKVCRIVE